MMRPLRVVALDLSTAATAIAHTHDSLGRPRLATYTIPTGARPLHQQIDTIEMTVRRVCGVDSGGVFLGDGFPDLVVIEGTFSRIGGSDYPLHALHGCVKQWLYRRQIPYADVAPSTVKVWATGTGATRGVNKVTKARVCTEIVAAYGRFLNINPRDDNQADAVALLTLGLAAYGQELAEVPHTHSRAIKAVEWPDLPGVA